MDSLSAYSMTIGIIILMVSWIDLLFRSAKEDFAWGLCTALLPPIGYTYGLLRLDIARDSWVMALLGGTLVVLGII